MFENPKYTYFAFLLTNLDRDATKSQQNWSDIQLVDR